MVVWPFAATYQDMAAFPSTRSGTDLSGDHTITLGAAKLWADGSIYVRTAWLSQPYHVTPEGDPHYRGFPRFKDKGQLMDMVKRLHADGWQLAIHTSGDQAVQDTLDAWEAAQAAHPRTDTRHVSVHAHTAREDQLDRMRDLGVSPSFFVTHTYFFGDRHWDIFLGPDRARRLTPCRTALDRGLGITLHNDTPGHPHRPAHVHVVGGEQAVVRRPGDGPRAAHHPAGGPARRDLRRRLAELRGGPQGLHRAGQAG